jgi:threonine dehydratase
LVTFDDVERAYQILKDVVYRTPLLTSRTFSDRSGNQIFLKAENFQRAGSFKLRGAFNKISSLGRTERRTGVVAYSSGNHAQGVALASSLIGVEATVVMPENASSTKVDATRSYGANVIFAGTTSDDRMLKAQELQAEFGLTIVPPYNDAKIISGQGTVALEILQDVQDLDYLFVPVGGGGLISGSGIAAKHLNKHVRIIAVETEAASDAYQSLRAGWIIKISPPDTIADGMRSLCVGDLNFEIMKKFVDDAVLVTENDVIDTMRFFMERMKIIVEPTGSAAPAALLKNVLGLKGKKACAIISGGNVDLKLLKDII